MTTLISPDPKLRFCDNNGNALSGGLLFAYQAGTTTKQNTFTDSTGNTANTNPIILNARGECNCWLTTGQAYKFVLSPSTDTDPPTNPIWTVDNIIGGISTPVAVASGGTGASTAATALANLGAVPAAGGTMTGNLVMSGARIDEASATLASAATVNIGAAAANYIFITGTTGITGFDTIQSGVERTLEFAGILTLTNSSSLILPNNGGNITTAAGDTAKFRSEGSGNWRCVMYTLANGKPLNGLRVAGTQAVLNPYATNSTVTQAHGLGAAPTEILWFMQCLTAELGYAVGDRIYSNQVLDANFTTNSGFTLSANPTNTIIQTTGTSTFEVATRTTGTAALITAANWKLVVTPYL